MIGWARPTRREHNPGTVLCLRHNGCSCAGPLVSISELSFFGLVHLVGFCYIQSAVIVVLAPVVCFLRFTIVAVSFFRKLHVLPGVSAHNSFRSACLYYLSIPIKRFVSFGHP